MRTLRSRLGAWILCAAGLGPSMAGAQIVVISNSVAEREATAGERYSGTIRLLNSGQIPQEVRLYQTDYSFLADGRTFYDTPGSHPRSNAPWIRVSPASVVIPAGELVDVSYEVEVPDGDTLRGTYWSMIMVEPVSPNPTGDVLVGGPGVGLRTVVRHGIQVATHMRGEVSHQLKFDDPKVVREGGGRYLEFVLVNEGDAAYRPKIAMEIYDRAGVLISVVEQQRGLVYPGTSFLQRFEITDLDDGTFEALVLVDTGAPQLFGGQFTLRLGDAR